MRIVRRLVCDGSRDCLPDPPGRIGRKLIPLRIVELFHCLDEPEITFLDQVQKEHPAPHIALGDADDQPQVGLGQLLLGRLVALAHTDGQLPFLVRRQKRYLADFLQVHANRVVDADRIRDHAFQVDLLRVAVFLAQLLVEVVLDNLDIHALQRVVQPVHLVRLDVDAFQHVGHLLAADRAFFFCRR